MIPEEKRRHFFLLAYNILGSREDAEDVVQECLLKYIENGRTNIVDKEAYLARSVINTAINLYHKRKKERVHYTGDWLPEPLISYEAPHKNDTRELSLGLLKLLEELNPLERAAFILREAFGYDYKEISALLEKSEDNCRQLLSRSRKKLEESKYEEHKAGSAPDSSLAEAFFMASDKGDFDALEKLLQKEAVMYSDGGGKVKAALNPLYGNVTIRKFFEGLARKSAALKSYKAVWVNGRPGIIIYLDGKADTVLTMDIQNNSISRMYALRNPDKLPF